jgi:hypothetical protein
MSVMERLGLISILLSSLLISVLTGYGIYDYAVNVRPAAVSLNQVIMEEKDQNGKIVKQYTRKEIYDSVANAVIESLKRANVPASTTK